MFMYWIMTAGKCPIAEVIGDNIGFVMCSDVGVNITDLCRLCSS